MNSYLKIAIVVAVFVAGFVLGRKTIDVKAKIEYVKGEVIRDTVKIPYPAFTEIPSTPQLPMKPDTISLDSVQIITEKVDTASIIHDYILQKTYSFNVFHSDTLGKLDVEQIIGYNKLLSFDYTFTPMTRQITHFKEPVFTPFITGGYSTNNSFLLGGGLYYKRIGIEYLMNVTTRDQIFSWQVDDPIIFNRLNKNEVYHTFKLNYKF